MEDQLTGIRRAGASSERDETALLPWLDWIVRLRGRAVASGEPRLVATGFFAILDSYVSGYRSAGGNGSRVD
jgi:hypothetical protein